MSTLRIKDLFTNSTHTVMAVEAVDFTQVKMNSGGYVFGSIVPKAVVVCGPEGVSAFDMQADPTSLTPLREAIPGLDSYIRQRTPLSGQTCEE